MRQLLSLILAFGILARSAEADSLAAQVAAIPQGARIEVHLKNKEKMRGTKGAATDIGFTLLGKNAPDRQIAFDDVASVKLFKSHTTRNVLGIGVVATVGIIAAVALRCGPLGCNSKL